MKIPLLWSLATKYCIPLPLFHYSLEELLGGGPGPKPMKKPRKKPRKDPAARPLAGAEVLVAGGGPSPERGEGKKLNSVNYDK